MLVVHPDSIMLIVSLVGGIAAALIFSVDLSKSSDLADGVRLLIIFLLPSLILGETMSMDRGFFVRKLWANIVYSFVGVIGNAIGLALIFYWVGLQTWGHYNEWNSLTLSTLGIILTMSDDTGYKMILTLVKDKELYTLTRERFLTNFIMAICFLYMLSEKLNPMVLTLDTNTYIIEGFLVVVISGTLGLAIGFLTTLIQKNFSAIRNNVVAEIMFMFCIIYLCTFVGAVNSFFLSEDIILVFFGIFSCAYSRYNFTLESAERMSFLLQLFSRLCRIGVLAVIGLMVARSFLITDTWYSLVLAIPCVFLVTFLGHVFYFSLAAMLGSVKFTGKNFFISYFANLCKGPLCYLLIEKYMPTTGFQSDLALAFTVFCTFLAPPLLYLTHVIYKTDSVNDDSIDEMLKKSMEINEQMAGTKNWLARFINFISEKILSPLLIYHYSARYDRGIHVKLRKIFLRSIKFAEASMDTTKRSKRTTDEEVSRILSASKAAKGHKDSSLNEPLNHSLTHSTGSIGHY